MRIFYDESGNVIGTLEGLPEIEQAASMEGAAKITVPEEIVYRLNDRLDPLTRDNITVVNDQIQIS